MLTTFSEHWKRDRKTNKLLNVNQGKCLLEKALDADELGIFKSDNFNQMLEFKW